MCVDYLPLNNVTVKNKYHVPNVEGLFDRVCSLADQVYVIIAKVPAGDGVDQFGNGRPRTRPVSFAGEAATDELAERQSVIDCRVLLGALRELAAGIVNAEPVHLALDVGIVSRRPVVAATARARRSSSGASSRKA